jgi:hypothetical protein
MPRFVWITLLCLAAASQAFGEEKKNLVLEKPYTYWPEPNYHHCTDKGDKTQLTDGETKYAPGMWMFPTTVGWSPALDVPVVVHFDLGEEATVNELVFNSCGGGGAGVVQPGLRVLVSLDDESYVPAGEMPAQPSPPEGKRTQTAVQLRVPLKGARARYVAVVAIPPKPFYHRFVDEIEVYGKVPADPTSILPIQTAITATGAQGLQELLGGGRRAQALLDYLVTPVERHINCWPENLAEVQRSDLNEFRGRVVKEQADFKKLQAELTERHRLTARKAYGADKLIWEVPPDDEFTMLTLPETLHPAQSASIHTVINSLEATALGVANLTAQELPLKVSVTGPEVQHVSARVARFAETGNARFIPDVLLATDTAHVIPSGESRLIWLSAESTGSSSGTFEYEVAVTVGEDVHSVPLTVHVHDVSLSAKTPLSNGNWSYLSSDAPLTALVRDSMLSHRLTVGAASAQALPQKDAAGNLLLPMEIDFSSMDKFLEFHKDFDQVSWFYAFHQYDERPHRDWFGPADWMSEEFKEVFREWIVQIVAHIRSRGRDYDEFYFHMFDETLDEKVAQLCELVHEADPKVRMMITVPQASKAATARMVKAGMNVFALHAPRIEYDNAPDGFGVLQSDGRELWFYGAADSEYGGGKERNPLGFFRYLHWAAYRHGATGVHFWNMLHNNGGAPLWEPERTGQDYWPMVYPIGEGYQAPPEDVKTAEKIIPSRRWEYVRMGIEDYMLLQMAEDFINRLDADGKIHQSTLDEIVGTVLRNRVQDRKLFRQKRRELVELVEALNQMIIEASGMKR